MGRKKQSRPVKRRRVILEADDSVVAEEQTTLMEHQHHENQGVDGENEMARAIDLLRKTPSHQVEAAAAEATRLDLSRNDRWIHLRLPKVPSSRSPTTTTTFAIAFSECSSNEETQPSSNQTREDDQSVLKTSIQAVTSTGDDKVTPDTVENASTNTARSSAELSSHIPSWARGLGFARLGIEDFEALQELHQLIKDRVNRRRSEKNNNSSSSDLEWASWSGSIEDPRKRAFGFLPGTWGYDPEIRNDRLDITMPQSDVDDETRNGERIRNKRAMLVLEKSEVPKGVETAISNLCQQFRTSLLSKEKECHAMTDNDNGDHEYRTRLAQFLHYEYMIAAQPNLHSGRALLPVHLDDPRKDGFGVVIVTIGMEGAGTIVLRDAKGIQRGVAMRLERGDAYMLSDRARDACSHGVLADESSSERESLNLRFGLHDLASPCIEGDIPSVNVVPSSMVFRHWE